MDKFGPVELVTFVAILGCGLMAGLFFAFSVAVMKALGGLPAAHGIAAMQSINRVIVNRLFLAVFFGTSLACLATVVGALTSWGGAARGYALAGSLLYLVGNLLVTMLFNVPRNNALAGVAPASADGARLWESYLSGWTAWNHVRTLTALAALACLVAALVQQTRSIE